MSSTRYTLWIDGDASEFAKATKATVVAFADATRKGGDKRLLEVRTDAGNVVHALPAVKTRVITFHTKPYTKTITLPVALRDLVPDGYVAAYARLRNGAIVLRNEDADEESRYAVISVRTGDVAGYAGTTREAGAIMKGLKVVA